MESSSMDSTIIEETDNIEKENVIKVQKNIHEDIVEKDIKVTKVEEQYRKCGILKAKITTTETITERIIKRQISNGTKGKIDEDDLEENGRFDKSATSSGCFISRGEKRADNRLSIM